GCVRAERGGWGVFADLAGKDRYRMTGTPGGATDKGLGVFFDGGGEDEYPKSDEGKAPMNGVTRRDGNGGLFVDRSAKIHEETEVPPKKTFKVDGHAAFVIMPKQLD